MTDVRVSTPPEDLAGEYALGVLSGDELRRARTLARTNSEFRHDVSVWLGQLAPMLGEVSPVEPPASAWTEIERRISGSEAGASDAAKLRRTVRRWRVAAAGLAAIAACLAIIVLGRLVTPDRVPIAIPVERPVGTPLVAILGDQQKQMKGVANWNPEAQQLVLAIPAVLPASADQSRELWVIPAGGKPQSLGLLPSGQQSHLRLTDELARELRQGATIAISVEPSGGSPTGTPSGPVVASGLLSRA